jgi:hypothetical protein
MGIVLGWVRVSILPLRKTLLALLRGIHFSIVGRVTKRKGHGHVVSGYQDSVLGLMAPVLSKNSNEPGLRCNHGSQKNLNKKKPINQITEFFLQTTAFVTAGSFEKTRSLWVSLRRLVIEITGTDRVARPVAEHLVSQRCANFWRVIL